MTTDPGKSEQLRFWRGDFGNEYTDRNTNSARELRARVALWAPIMARLEGAMPESILEVGANIGNNLRALRQLSDAEFFAIEPNEKARGVLVDDGVVPRANVRDGFAAAINLDDGAVDLAFTSGVLIHIHPDDLLASCSEIHRVARRYVVCIEYFSDKVEEITYRGHSERLFKRDFGSFWMDSFPDLAVLDYGFAWKRTTGLDNLTWWLMEKR
jgi:spore coat polysaccharide biosynthesis protein SpsF